MNYEFSAAPVHRTTMHDFKNVGRLLIGGIMLREHSDILQQIYSMVLPTQVIYDGHTDTFGVTGLSVWFRDVERGTVIPEYDCIVTETPFGDMIKFVEKT